MNKSLSETASLLYLENLLTGNRSACSRVARQYLDKNPSIMDLYEEVFKVSLYEIGKLWETNKISIATEHMATAITEGILNEFFEQIISTKRYNKKVVVACVENEKHQVGIKMVADVFEMNGWESFFLGAGIPHTELVRFVCEVQPDLLAISVSIYFNFASLIKLLDLMRKEFPDIQILIGGQAFRYISPEIISRLGNAILLTDLYLLEKFIQSINNNQT